MGRDRESHPSFEGELNLDLLWDEDPDLDAPVRKPPTANPCQKATLSLALDGTKGAKKSRDSEQLLAAVEPHRTRSSQSMGAVRQPVRAWSEPPCAGVTPEPPEAEQASDHITSDDPFALPTQPPPPSLNPALGGTAAEPDGFDPTGETGEMSAPGVPDFSEAHSPPPEPVEPGRFDETSFGDVTAELEAESADASSPGDPLSDDLSPQASFACDWAQNDIATRPPPAATRHNEPEPEPEPEADVAADAGPASGIGATATGGDVVRRAAGHTGISLDDAAYEALEAVEELEAGALGLVSRRARLSDRPSTTSLPAVEPVATPSTAPGTPTTQDMQDRFEVGDYSGALELASLVLATDGDNTAARLMADECTTTLTQMLSARLGSLTQRPTVGLPLDQIRWLSLDHRAGFLLSLMDGQLSIDDVLDVSGMPRLDAMRLLADLVEQRVIALAPA